MKHKKVVFENLVSRTDSVLNPALYEFIASGVLHFLLSFCEEGECITIKSKRNKANVTISVEGMRAATVRRIKEKCIEPVVYDKKSKNAVDLSLLVCYEIICFYGGDLWSELSILDVGRICFRIPGHKEYAIK